MSNVIKKSVQLNNVVSVGKQKNDENVLGQSKNKFKGSLNFKGSVDATINNLQNKINNRISHIEESSKNEFYERGFNEGKEKEYAERKDYIDTHFSDQFKIIDTLLNNVKKKEENAIKEVEEKIIGLALSISEKIIHKSIEADPTIVEEIVTEALSHLVENESLILKVSAKDFEFINAQYERWMDLAGSSKEFKIEIDKRLNSGDCFIETEGGIIDASISSRLDVLAEELLKANK